MRKTLEAFGPGQRGRVVAVEGEGGLKRRLIDMGITPGTEILVRRLAPMGDPIEIALRGYALSIRRGDAACILLETGEVGR